MRFGFLHAAGALLLLAVLSMGPAVAAAQSGTAQEIFALTNRDRAAHGLPALRWSAALQRSASAHAALMAREPALAHDYPGEPNLLERARHAGARFQTIAENIASGWSAEQINTAWMHSPPHRRNILDPRLDSLGVAVVRRGGQLFAVEDFSAAVQALNPGQVEARVRALLEAEHVDASAPASPAKAACRQWRGLPPGSGARAVVRFQTSDLSQLPGAVTQEIRSGKFRRAAVGACAPPSADDFTTFRVAILFY